MSRLSSKMTGNLKIIFEIILGSFSIIDRII